MGMDGFTVLGTGPIQALSQPETFDVSLQTYLQANLSARIYPGHIPQRATLPAYSYFRQTETPRYYLAGPATGLADVQYQFDCWSTTYLDVSVMESALRQALHGYRGLMGSTMVFSVRLMNVYGAPAEAPVEGDDQWTYHTVVEYHIFYQEQVPQF
jgi:hypothetical protein